MPGPNDLKSKLYAYASAFIPLRNLLGTGATGDPFRWCDTQLISGIPFPAVVVRVMPGPQMYTFAARLATNWNLGEFKIFDHPDSAAADDVAKALFSFLDSFNAIGIPNLSLYPNLVITDRDDLEPAIGRPAYMRVIDAKIFDNSSVQIP